MEKEFYKSIGMGLRNFRKNKRMSIEVFSKFSGLQLSKSCLSEIENGHQKLSLYQYYILKNIGFNIGLYIPTREPNKIRIPKIEAEKILDVIIE